MVDGVSVVTFDLVANEAPVHSSMQAQVSLFDVAHFESMHNLSGLHFQQPISVDSVNRVGSAEASNGFRTALELLQSLNGNSDSLGVDALRFSAERQSMTPGEMLNLTMHAHHFLFQSELTANVANKTSDGIQQLFRQQS